MVPPRLGGLRNAKFRPPFRGNELFLDGNSSCPGAFAAVGWSSRLLASNHHRARVRDPGCIRRALEGERGGVDAD